MSALRESRVQLVIRRHRVALIKLSYPVVATRLLSEGFLLESQHQEIKSKSADGVDRMDDLISLLHNLNSVDTVQSIIQGAEDCGAAELAVALKTDMQSDTPILPTSILLGSQSPFVSQRNKNVFIPEILEMIFKNFPPKDLLTGRLVCQKWNDLVLERFVTCFELSFRKDFGNKMGTLLAERGTSPLLQGIQKFRFGPAQDFDQVRTISKNLFRAFGPNMKELTLDKGTNELLADFIFTRVVQHFLRNVQTLNLFCTLKESTMDSTSLEFLLTLEHLSIRATQEVSEYGQMKFLEKFTTMPHRLKSLSLHNHFCVGDIPNGVWLGLFKTGSLESLSVPPTVLAVQLNEENLGSMIVRGDSSRLRQFEASLSCTAVPIFHRFLVSHRLSLQTVRLIMEVELLEAFPRMENLRRLHLSIEWNGRGESAPFGMMEQFLDRAPELFPKLAKLNMVHGGRGTLPEKCIFHLTQVRKTGESSWS